MKKKRSILKRCLAVTLSILTLCVMPMTAYAEIPPPIGGLPLVVEDGNDSSTTEQPEPDEPGTPSSEAGATEPTASQQEDETYTVGPDTTEGAPYGQGTLYPLPWDNIECDTDGNPYYGPVLYAEGDTGYQGIIECSWMPYTNPSMPDKPNQPWLLVKIGGKIAYCIDPFNHRSDGGVQFVEKNDYNKLDTDIKDTISYIMRYGAKSDSQDTDNIYLHMATQTLIWEVVQGTRQPYTLTGSSGGVYQDLAARYPGVVAKYNQLMNSVVAWGKIPSFAVRQLGNAPTYALEGEGPYKRELTNITAGLNLSDFDFPSAGGITFAASGNTLTASATSPVTTETLITCDRKGATKGGSKIFWFDPSANPNQTRSSPGPDPVPAYFKIGAADTEPDTPDTPDEPSEYYIEISKYETGTNTPLSGAQFEVRYLGGIVYRPKAIDREIIIVPTPTPEPDPGEGISTFADSGDNSITEPEHHFVATVTSGADGKVKVKVPYSGVYQVTEQVPPANHKLSDSPVQTVTVNKDTPSATAKISYHNEPFTGIVVKKIDSTNSQPVAGATIRLEQIDGNIAQEAVTGADGTVSFTNLPAASYKVFEKYAPDNYVINTTVFPAELQANQSVTIVIPNTPKPGLIIRKVDQDGKPLQGALFRISEKDGPLICEKISDQNGVITQDNLPKKWITVEEIQPPAHHLLDPDGAVRDVNMLDGGDQEIVFRNPKKPSLLVEKVDADNPNKKLPGAVIRVSVEDSPEYTEAVTGPDGTALFEDLPNTWLTIWEEQAPAGYATDKTKRIVQMVPGKIVTLTLKNSGKPGLLLRKVDMDSGEGIPGTVLRLAREGSLTYQDYTMDKNGTAFVEGLEAGVAYTVTEQSVPAPYQLDQTPHTVILSPGETTEVIIQNTKKPGLLLRKIDELTLTGIPNVTLRIAEQGSLTHQDVVTGPDGTVFIEGLKAGATYEITEIAAPDFVVLDPAPHYITLKTGTNTLTITNQSKPSLRLLKLDAKAKEPVQNAEFSIRIKNGKDLGVFRTNHEGIIELINCEPNTYVITEIKCEGYNLLKDPVEALVEPNKITTITLENEPANPILIKKVDHLGKPLMGAIFEVEKITGEYVGSFESGRTGFCTITGQSPGFFKVWESKAPEGYLFDESVKIVELKANQPCEVEFVNKPLAEIRIYKEDAKDKTPIEGASFEISEKGGQSLGVFKTNASGEIICSGLSPNWYTITEVAPAPGYLLDAQPRDVLLSWGEVKRVIFSNTKFSGLQLRKINGVDKQPMEGVSIRISKLSGEVLGTYKTSAQGEILAEVEPGWYVCKEIETLPGFLLDPEPIQVEVKKGENTFVEFQNYPLNTLVLHKKSTGGEPLANITFKLTDADGKYIGSYRTGLDRTFSVPGLKPGKYVLTETAVPDNVVLDSSPHLVELVEGQPCVVELLNELKGGAVLYKYDKLTKKPIAGARLRLTTMENGIVRDVVTGLDGSAAISPLEPGYYKAFELEVPAGYLLDQTPQTFQVEKGKPAIVEFYDYPVSSFLLKKTDPQGNPLDSVWFRISTAKGESVGEYETNSAGLIAVQLEPGAYIAEETKTKPGYLLDKSPRQFVVEEGKNAELSVINKPLNSLSVYKKNSATGEPIPGCVFRLEKLSGELVGTYTTSGVTGSFTVPNLQPGSYRCYELSCPVGFVLDPTPQVFELSTGESKELLFENTPLVGLQLLKWDSVNSKPIPNVEFSIRELSGKLLGSFTTDSSGRLFIPNLKEGWIEVTETKAAPGFKPDAAPRKVLIKANEPNYIRVDNLPWPVLSIRKVDKGTNTPLAGARIRISDAYNRELGAYTTSASGSITLTGMDAQTVFVQEIEAPAGYELDSSIHEITLEWGKTAKLELTNRRLSTFRLRKIDSVTRKPIYNCAFLLYDNRNNVIEEYTTDQNGVIEFPSELPEGRYKVKEIRTDSGHVLDDTIRTITLKSGETTELVVENEPVRGRIQITKKSAEYNGQTKLKKGAPLSGAVFEIFDRTNSVVDRIRTNSRGIATSKPLPLGVYGIREITAPEHYLLNDKVFYAEIKAHDDLVKFVVEDENEDIGVTIQKAGNIEAMPGDLIRYDLQNIRNASNVPLDDFYVRDVLPNDAVRMEKIHTGTWSGDLTYTVAYKTNRHTKYRTAAYNLHTNIDNVIDMSSAKLGLAANEYVTEIKFLFGTVQPGFRSRDRIEIYCTVQGDLPDGYRFTNCADVGGSRDSKWIIDKDCWTTVLYDKPKGKLPKTGF